MSLPVIIAALFGKAAVAGGKTAATGIKAATSHHANGAVGRELASKVRDEVVSQLQEKAADKTEARAKSWWSRGKRGKP